MAPEDDRSIDNSNEGDDMQHVNVAQDVDQIHKDGDDEDDDQEMTDENEDVAVGAADGGNDEDGDTESDGNGEAHSHEGNSESDDNEDDGRRLFLLPTPLLNGDDGDINIESITGDELVGNGTGEVMRVGTINIVEIV